MADLEPGVVLSADTVAAMERLATPPRIAMTEQHKATPDDIIELRDRVAALEAAQRPTVKESLTVPPSPAGSLVDRLASVGVSRFYVKAAILEVAAWLRSEYPRREGYGTAWANLIEQEANR